MNYRFNSTLTQPKTHLGTGSATRELTKHGRATHTGN